MSNIDKQLSTDLLIANALETAKQLRELQESPVAEAIFESIIENENGKEIQFERPISDLAYTAFLKIERLVEALEAAEKRVAELERSETQLIDERDNAESALADMYEAGTGERPEWSNAFGFCDAVDEVRENVDSWIRRAEAAEKRIDELEVELKTADKLQDSAFRHGLQHGFSLGQTDNQAGFEECLSAYGTAKGEQKNG